MGLPKALLDWGGMPLVRWQAETLLAGGVEAVVVVTGAEHAAVSAAIENAGGAAALHNPDHAAGRSSSVRVAALAAPGSELAIFCNVDQPLCPELVALLLGAARDCPEALLICPEVNGRRIHPVLFRSELYSDLATVDEASQGLRAVIAAKADRLRMVAADPAWAPPHFNYPEEYEAAWEARFGTR